MTKIGELLRYVRNKEKLTQIEFAQSLGYKHRSTVANWESGKVPKIPTVVVDYILKFYIDDIVEIRLNELLEETRNGHNTKR